MLPKWKYLRRLTNSGTHGFMPTDQQNAFDRILFSQPRLQRYDHSQLGSHYFNTAIGGNHSDKNSHYSTTPFVASLYNHFYTHQLHSKIN